MHIHSFREEAQIIINLRGNPNQICIRFESLKEAIKQFDKINKQLTARMRLEAPDEVITITGPTNTSVVKRASIEAWTLCDMLALAHMMEQSQLPRAAAA